MIRIVATSYKYEPNLIQVRHAEDVSPRRHWDLGKELRGNAVIPLLRVLVAELQHHYLALVEFVASTRGSFAFFCGISNHAALGQVGAINVLPPQ